MTTSIEDNSVAIEQEEKAVEQLPTMEVEKNDAVAIHNSTPTHTTLIITTKESDEYLNKKELAQATSKEKKSSTLKKLLKKADDLTNDQDPFGELRQKKNEILALNFKTDKQRGQNKWGINKMKKTFLIAVMAWITFSAQAQTGDTIIIE